MRYPTTYYCPVIPGPASHALEGKPFEVRLEVGRAPGAPDQALHLPDRVLEVALRDAGRPLPHQPLLPLEGNLVWLGFPRSERDSRARNGTGERPTACGERASERKGE